ncbi:hypothetical protein LSAT2_020542, partial [Lamellibrachia satsuma]
LCNSSLSRECCDRLRDMFCDRIYVDPHVNIYPAFTRKVSATFTRRHLQPKSLDFDKLT